VCVVSISPQRPPAVGAGLRWARAGCLAVAAWSVAGAAHLLGGGDLPTFAIMVLLIAVTAAAMTVPLLRQASGLRLVVLLGAGQTFMHAAFDVSAGWKASGALPRSAMSGMSMSGPHAHADQAASVMMPETGSLDAGTGVGHTMSILPSPLMVLAHLGAAVVLGAVLAIGERALFTLLAHLAQLAGPVLRTGRRVLLALALAAIPARRELRLVAGGELSWLGVASMLPGHLLVRAVSRRGPPASALAPAL